MVLFILLIALPVDCPNADDGFVADACNASCWYTCEGMDSAVQRCCHSCDVWSQDILTCIPDVNQPNCTYDNTTVEAGKYTGFVVCPK